MPGQALGRGRSSVQRRRLIPAMMRQRPTSTEFRPEAVPVAAVLDEAGSHHDMGFNDILVEHGSALATGLKE